MGLSARAACWLAAWWRLATESPATTNAASMILMVILFTFLVGRGLQAEAPGVPWISAEQFHDGFAPAYNLEGTAEWTVVFLVSIDIERVADGGKEIFNLDRAVLDLGSVLGT